MLACFSSTTLPAQSKTNSSMQEYLLIFRFKSNFVPPSQDSLQANIRRWQDYMTNLAQSGKLVSGFRPSNEGKTISGSGKQTRDGVYIANNDLVSSVIIVKAASMDEACEIARKCPIFEFDGSIEIRPLMNTVNEKANVSTSPAKAN